MSEETFIVSIREQSADSPARAIKVNVLSEEGKLWIQPEGYGDKTSADGEGFPIGLEIWRGRLRLIVFADISTEDPQIIDLENAKETVRMTCNWCGKEMEEEVIKWKGVCFCSDACLDECRAAQ